MTDRGEVVAELRQPSPRIALPYLALLEGVRHGRALVGLPHGPDLYPALGRVMRARPERAAGGELLPARRSRDTIRALRFRSSPGDLKG